MNPPLVLLNPHAAGGRAGRLAEPIRGALAGRAARLAVAGTVAEAEATLAALPRGTRVVVAGGDGTLHRLLPFLLAGDHELALMPCGTGNDTARALGVHRLPWTEALACGLEAPARRIDLGEVEHGTGRTPFISSLCAGFDAAVGENGLLPLGRVAACLEQGAVARLPGRATPRRWWRNSALADLNGSTGV